tara:strand:+ start:95468 stop:95791 length:324 start_codon:yes stop_codon:yes gene_type:complete
MNNLKNHNSEVESNRGTYIFLGITVISMIILYILWEHKQINGLSCMGVQSNLNKLVTEFEKYESVGGAAGSEELIYKDVQESIMHNRELNCGFNEKNIRIKFKMPKQ